MNEVDVDSSAAESQVVLTDKAAAKVREFAAEHPEADGKLLRIYVQGGSKAAYEYGFTFDEPHAGDHRLRVGEVEFLVDRFSLMYMSGSTVDFVEDLRGSGCVVDNPTLPPLLQDPVARRVNELIEQRITPGIASHGGTVDLLDYAEGKVYVRLGGGCQGCGMVDVTLKQGIEALLRQEIPEIVEVVDTTDHASGTNPYYTSGK
jgi:Fe/S biogenesis protein NfuA